MIRRRIAISLVLAVAAIAPGATPAEAACPRAGFSSIHNPGQFKLKRVGFGPISYGRARQLQAALHPKHPNSPAGIGGVIEDANRHSSPLLSRQNHQPGSPSPVFGVPGALGYGFNHQDNHVGHWIPQGITGSEDADISGINHGTIGGAKVQAVSWHYGDNSRVRISFVTPDTHRYRHVLLVRPTGSDHYHNIGVHAGGIAWVRNYMYVVDTHGGLRVFDTARIVHVPKSRLGDYGRYAYLLPQVASFLNVGKKLSYSSVSLDRQNPSRPYLNVGEFAKGAGGKIVRWRLNPSTGLISPLSAVRAYRSGFAQVQGVLIRNRRIFASSSYGPRGLLFYGKPNRRGACARWGRSPEDLYFSGGRLFSLTERKGERVVFGVPGSRLGLR